MRQISKGFSTRGRAWGTLFSSKYIAIALCLIFIGSLTGFYYMAESGFNPNPQPSSLAGANLCFPARQTCPGFTVGNLTLRELNRTDINSQQVSFFLVSGGSATLTSVHVYVNNVSLGTVRGPFNPGEPRLVTLGVPTTVVVTPGVSYNLIVEGTVGGASGAQSEDYWQSVEVVATGG